MIVSIDKSAGFCWGVIRTIDIAEAELHESGAESPLYVLGDIIHNPMEIERLERKGLKTITHADLADVKAGRVLVRAHGEPPSTFTRAAELGITVIDATCPVVWKVQERIKKFYDKGFQVVIYGNVQAFSQSRDMFNRLRELAREFEKEGLPGKLVVRTDWNQDDHILNVAAS